MWNLAVMISSDIIQFDYLTKKKMKTSVRMDRFRTKFRKQDLLMWFKKTKIRHYEGEIYEQGVMIEGRPSGTLNYLIKWGSLASSYQGLKKWRRKINDYIESSGNTRRRKVGDGKKLQRQELVLAKPQFWKCIGGKFSTILL